MKLSTGQVAQLVEHGPEKAGVGGSSPPLSTCCKSIRNNELHYLTAFVSAALMIRLILYGTGLTSPKEVALCERYFSAPTEVSQAKS